MKETRSIKHLKINKEKKDHIKLNKNTYYIKKIIKEYPDIYLIQIHQKLKDKFKDYEISWQHLHDVIRDNNITRKRISHQHFPKKTYGKDRDEKKEIKEFFKKIKSIDETSIKGGIA